MDLTIPDNDKEFFKQIWKINGLQNISKEDLIYKICYRMNLPYRPNTFNKKIKSAVNKGILLKEDKELSLTKELIDEIKLEENEAKIKIPLVFPREFNTERIEGNLDLWRYNDKRQSPEKESISTDYNSLLKKVFSKDEIERGRKIPSEKVNYKEIDSKKGIIESTVEGSKGNQYILTIDLKNRAIIHDCQDYQKNRKHKKEFCKHFYRVILNLRNKDADMGLTFLESIKEERNKWKFQ
jgi:hypothetical protein